MADMGMVERASRAMCRRYYEKRTLDPIPPGELDQLVDQMWDSWADEAQVAIEAIQTGECICAKCGLRHGITANDLDDDVAF